MHCAGSIGPSNLNKLGVVGSVIFTARYAIAPNVSPNELFPLPLPPQYNHNELY
ncbi:MAG: hypothetical protein ACM3VV_03085 [Deltaproteobacteria bacterium]